MHSHFPCQYSRENISAQFELPRNILVQSSTVLYSAYRSLTCTECHTKDHVNFCRIKNFRGIRSLILIKISKGRKGIFAVKAMLRCLCGVQFTNKECVSLYKQFLLLIISYLAAFIEFSFPPEFQSFANNLFLLIIFYWTVFYLSFLERNFTRQVTPPE